MRVRVCINLYVYVCSACTTRVTSPLSLFFSSHTHTHTHTLTLIHNRDESMGADTAVNKTSEEDLYAQLAALEGLEGPESSVGGGEVADGDATEGTCVCVCVRSMCMCVCVCVYVCVCAVCVLPTMRAYACVYVHTYININMYTCVCVCAGGVEEDDAEAALLAALQGGDLGEQEDEADVDEVHTSVCVCVCVCVCV
jgi:hypothetical protein